MRYRALRSLQFKLQHGLLDAAALGAAPERLLDFLAAEPQPAADALAALELLAAAATDPATAARLLRCGADRVLIQLADEAAPPVCSAATDVLGQLLTAAAEAPPWQEPAGGGGPESSAATPAPLQPASHQLVLWSHASPQHLPPLPSPPPAATPASPPPRPKAPPPDLEQVLARCGRRVLAPQLSEEDSQQLFEVALELAEQADEAALLATLATLRHGVLADMPAAAVAAEPSLVQALLRLAARGGGGGAGSPAAAGAALQALGQLAAGLTAAGEAGEGKAGLSLAPLAYQGLLRCGSLLNDCALQHEALHAALALVPLLAPAPGGAAGQPGAAVMAPLLAVLSDAVRLSLVS